MTTTYCYLSICWHDHCRFQNSARREGVSLEGRARGARMPERWSAGEAERPSGGVQKTCGWGVKRPQIVGMGSSTFQVALWQGFLACRENGCYADGLLTGLHVAR